MKDTSKSSQAGNSTTFKFSFSMSSLSFFKMDSILSSGFRTTLQVKFLSGTVSFTSKGIVEGGGRWSVRYLHGIYTLLIGIPYNSWGISSNGRALA